MRPILISIFFVFVSLNVFAASSHKGLYRSPRQSDIEGLWRQIDAKPGAIQAISDPWYSGDQLFLFTDDKFVKNLVSYQGKLKSSAKDLIELSPKSTQYSLKLPKGHLNIKYAEGTEYNIVCTFVTEETRKDADLQKGDLVMAYVDEDSKEVLFYRHLRKESK